RFQPLPPCRASEPHALRHCVSPSVPRLPVHAFGRFDACPPRKLFHPHFLIEIPLRSLRTLPLPHFRLSSFWALKKIVHLVEQSLSLRRHSPLHLAYYALYRAVF